MISGIWDNEYVQMLGILDHIDEIRIIKDEIRRIKNCTESKDTTIAKSHLDNELADLYLLLEKYLSNKEDIVNEREDKFREKSKDDK
jgi:hypothetical protein